MSPASDSSVWELFWTKCKNVKYTLIVWLPIHLWSHLPHALVLSSAPQHHHPGPLPFSSSRVDLYHRSCISASHNLSCFLLSSLSQFTIVFQFGMAPFVSRFSELLWWSPNKFRADLSPPNPLSPSFSGGLSQGQEFRVVCLPRIEQISDGQLWGAIVGSGVPGLDWGFTDARGCLWACVVHKWQWSSHQCQPLLQNSADYSGGSSRWTYWKPFKTTSLLRIMPRRTFQLCCPSSETFIEQSNNQNPPANTSMLSLPSFTSHCGC